MNLPEVRRALQDSLNPSSQFHYQRPNPAGWPSRDIAVMRWAVRNLCVYVVDRGVVTRSPSATAMITGLRQWHNGYVIEASFNTNTGGHPDTIHVYVRDVDGQPRLQIDRKEELGPRMQWQSRGAAENRGGAWYAYDWH